MSVEQVETPMSHVLGKPNSAVTFLEKGSCLQPCYEGSMGIFFFFG